ncbi:ribosome maturation factor RimM [Lactobacillus sp. ESL0785]|uniref:ribosome maturation factor RimM n=1 Tax=Lactobacillus sp. ESL0785 TaxID=2983232 RepID=UPI0023F752AE|nr:ribosome maturation factor RimM [Lactobacillus sp. ESL0785]WEV70310.1 ribosome maturation factor RimM [Lactobacillus sp. ESL0785]
MHFYDVAHIVATHGLKGEVNVVLVTDFPEERFAPGSKLTLKEDNKRVLTVVNGRPFKKGWLIQFAEVSDIDQAEQLKGQTLVISEDEQHDLPAGTYYYRDILGCTVIDNLTGANLGKVTEIASPGANDVWQITEESGNEYLIPYIDDVVKKIDVPAKQIYVELMAGLRDED